MFLLSLQDFISEHYSEDNENYKTELQDLQELRMVGCHRNYVTRVIYQRQRITSLSKGSKRLGISKSKFSSLCVAYDSRKPI